MKMLRLSKFLFAAGLLLNSVFAYAVDISTAADLAAALADDPAGSYTLTADMDLSSTDYAMLPAFKGVIDGNGHVLSWRGSTPLFDKFQGTIKNIVVDGSLDSANTTMTGTGRRTIPAIPADVAEGIPSPNKPVISPRG